MNILASIHSRIPVAVALFALVAVAAHGADAPPANASAVKQEVTFPAKRYPPYPEAWGYDSGRLGGISYLCSVKDGDFYIFPGEYFKDVPKTKIRGLFSGDIIELPPKEAETAVRDGKAVSKLGQLACREYYNYPSSLTLPNGYTVKGACVGGSCQHPFGIGVEVLDQDQRIIVRKVFLYLFEKPQHISVPRPAAEGGAIDILGRVFRLDPHFVPLRDNTFLFFGGGALVRFDAQFNTLFPINRGHLFVVDTTLIEEIYRKASEKVPADEVVWNQLVQEMIATRLDKIKQEKRP